MTTNNIFSTDSTIEPTAAQAQAIIDEIVSEPLAPAQITVPPALTIEHPTDPEIVTTSQLIEYFQKHDPLVIKMIEEGTKLLNSLEFLLDEDWLGHVVKGLKKPNTDQRTEVQLTTTVRKQLRDKAISDSLESGEPVKLPSQDEIDAEVNKKLAERRRVIQAAKDKRLASARRAIKAQQK